MASWTPTTAGLYEAGYPALIRIVHGMPGIGGKVAVARYDGKSWWLIEPNSVFSLDPLDPQTGIAPIRVHFADVTHWMEIPDLPDPETSP